MSIGDLQGRAYTDPSSPEPPGICDDCGEKWMLSELHWQYDYRGRQLQNLRLLKCPRCLDDPQPQFKTIILPPDPVPVLNPRPGFYAQQEGAPSTQANAIQSEGGEGVLLFEGGGGIIELD